MKISKATQITCTVYHSVTSKALGALEALGVKDYHLQPSRAVVLRRKAGFLGIGGGIGLEEEPADRILCYVPAADAEATLQALAAACELNIPGRGSAVSEAGDIVAGSVWESHPLTPVPGTEEIATQDDLASITCTVTRGRGDRIVKAVLGLGMPMPQVTTGTGTGLRDKIGVIRVALLQKRRWCTRWFRPTRPPTSSVRCSTPAVWTALVRGLFTSHPSPGG